MKRRLQVLALCAAFMAARLMAQDASGGGAGMSGGGADSGGGDAGGATNATGEGATSQDNSGSSSSGNTGGGNSNGSAPGETPAPNGTGAQGDNGTGNTTTPTELPNAGAPSEGPGGVTPPELPAPLFPGEIVPSAAATPVPSATPFTSGSNPYAQAPAAQNTTQEAPTTFTLPGGYGSPGSQSFTLGQGRLAKPPITFTATVSEGYDTNIFDADSNPQPTPTPIPTPTPPLERRLIGFRIAPPTIVPLYVYFRAPAAPRPTPVKTLGVIASPVTLATVGIQVQHGTPRTVFTLDLSIGEQLYANEPGSGSQYTGNFDLTMIHRLTPRATISLAASAVYQNTPNFSLINAPTNNGSGGDYLNGDFMADFSYAWGSRLSTVTSAQVNFNLLQTSSANNLYQFTFGNQFRYNVSARNTVTAEIRDQQTVYPTNATANNSALFYLLGLDTIISRRLSNTIDGGLEIVTYPGGASQSVPYVETATTLSLPHQAALSWTNEYGSQASGSADVNSISYRTSLTLSQPLSSKLAASLSIAYNHVVSTDSTAASLGYTQDQLQSAFTLAFTVSPRLSLSMSYNYLDFLTSQLNSSYIRQQIYLGGTYTFK
jgi:hypothetical protein